MAWNTLFEEELEREGSILAQYTSSLVQNWYFVYKMKQHLSAASSRILEAGAGRGYIAIYFSYLGHEVVATDIDAYRLKKAAEFGAGDVRNANEDLSSIGIEHGDSRDLDVGFWGGRADLRARHD